jgi:hypothetical protein
MSHYDGADEDESAPFYRLKIERGGVSPVVTVDDGTGAAVITFPHVAMEQTFTPTAPAIGATLQPWTCNFVEAENYTLPLASANFGAKIIVAGNDPWPAHVGVSGDEVIVRYGSGVGVLIDDVNSVNGPVVYMALEHVWYDTPHSVWRDGWMSSGTKNYTDL